MPRDPRWYQIAVLAGLLVYGMLGLDFDVTPLRALVLVGAALATQWALGRATGGAEFEPRSALISALSLCLLLRTGSYVLAALVAATAVASKFALRVGDKHVFNPTNFGIMAFLAAGAPVWVSPGQWGQVALFGFLMAALGTVVVTRAARADVTFGFLAAYAAIVFGRAVWLGQPWANPMHQLANGGLILFAFFMISDPRTTPDSRAGRLVYAVIVAALAGFVTFGLFRPNGLLWALVALSPLVPVIDRVLPGKRHAWPTQAAAAGDAGVGGRSAEPPPRVAGAWTTALLGAVAAIAALGVPGAVTPAQAFCGFYVAESNAKLFNHSSQVVIARDGDHTVLTLANDYEGDPRTFALVVPVPVVLSKEQVHVGQPEWVDHLDKYSAPRLVDYPDPEPCPQTGSYLHVRGGRGDELQVMVDGISSDTKSSSTVQVIAAFTVDEYDIVILSATESGGLLAWLQQHGYQVPARAQRVLGTYIKQDMKFFVARVNLEKRAALGVQKLRPLPRFSLPIRLGMVNANGPQELTIYTITQHGRVEPTNYRMVKAPTGTEVPMCVKSQFPDFARAVFDHSVATEGMRTVFLEYAWNAGWCDPCASAPVPPDELRQLGAGWIDDAALRGGQIPAFVTRLHARYDAASFPEDLSFEETGNTENFQARYVLRTPNHGSCDCPQGVQYRKALVARREAQRASLVQLTGWSEDRVRAAMSEGEDAYLPAIATPAAQDHWWDKLWRR